MINLLVVIFFGWPAIIASLLFCVIGLFKNNYWLLVVSAIIALPFSWFISGFPHIQSPIFLLPLSPFTAAYAMRRGHEMIAWICALPLFLGVLLLFYVISAQ